MGAGIITLVASAVPAWIAPYVVNSEIERRVIETVKGDDHKKVLIGHINQPAVGSVIDQKIAKQTKNLKSRIETLEERFPACNVIDWQQEDKIMYLENKIIKLEGEIGEFLRRK